MYYPKSKIKENLYTNGSEFVNLVTGKSYVGYYHSTFDNKFFTGKTNTLDSEELQRMVSDKNDLSYSGFVYRKSNKKGDIKSTNIFPFRANPAKQDYDKGWFTRYFIKRVNGGIETIREVSEQDYDKSFEDILYRKMSLQWKLKGSIYDDKSNLNNPIYGVYDTNKRNVSSNEKLLPGISKYLVNLIEFALIV